MQTLARLGGLTSSLGGQDAGFVTERLIYFD